MDLINWVTVYLYCCGTFLTFSVMVNGDKQPRASVPVLATAPFWPVIIPVLVVYVVVRAVLAAVKTR